MLSPQFSLVRVTAPAALPISVAEAKAQMRVEGNDDDTIIERLVNAALPSWTCKACLAAR
jgi:hypothetical protein